MFSYDYLAGFLLCLYIFRDFRTFNIHVGFLNNDYLYWNMFFVTCIIYALNICSLYLDRFDQYKYHYTLDL